MNIILLSGGSGKRMWPLSNEVRSKQFIKLFKTENGEYESMVQRVYRQIKTVDKDANIVIATSKSQVSAIYNQLGEKVSVCVEPCRRDTFPAIALASIYLCDKMNVSEEKSVVVCPVDPYVENSYYKCVKNLSDIAEQGSYKLNLMGIEPTYPSEKYGYIIPDNLNPDNLNNIGKVKEFKEKPDAETAQKYIDKGAFWNAGVFAFKLKYMLDISHSLIDYIDYDDLYRKYDSLEKISFDYAVAEKEKSVCVMKYSGEWRDVGTWNTMSEVMSDYAKGNVTLDEKCFNTHVINELDIPLLCMGVENMVIAASSDGILISDKKRSGYMKAYVDKIKEDIRFAEKSWGTYRVIDVQSDAMTVIISLQKGNSMKYHMHKLRKEIWTVISGNGEVIIDDLKRKVSAGDVIEIPIGAKHRITAFSDMNIIEVQIGGEISLQDKIKLNNEGIK